MKMKTLLLPSVALLAIGVVMAVDPPNEKAPVTEALLLDQLESPHDRNECFEAYRRLSANHERVVRRLIQIADTEKDDAHDSRALAARLLADFGSREAIPMLVKHVEYTPRRLLPLFEPFDLVNAPFAQALEDFGLASLPAILHHLQTSPEETNAARRPSDGAIWLYAQVLINVYHDRIGGGEELIATVERASQRAHRKHNLRRLLDQLKRWPKPLE